MNLAIRLSARQAVSIADLDLVNPYFRCREARAEMESFGIRVINPEGEYVAADLPIVLPEIRGALAGGSGTLIFDVGGDDVGARVLSSLADVFAGRPYTMLQVVNSRRPFTETVEGCLKIKREIEAASRLQVTALVSNAHLLEETDAETVTQGLELTRAVSRGAELPVAFVTANEGMQDNARTAAAWLPGVMDQAAHVAALEAEEHDRPGSARVGARPGPDRPERKVENAGVLSFSARSAKEVARGIETGVSARA